jgi:hypothetical protein
MPIGSTNLRKYRNADIALRRGAGVALAIASVR